jgi:hypothetical protein
MSYFKAEKSDEKAFESRCHFCRCTRTILHMLKIHSLFTIHLFLILMAI